MPRLLWRARRRAHSSRPIALAATVFASALVVSFFPLNVPTAAAAEASSCTAGLIPVRELLNPSTGAALYTTSASEQSSAQKYGFTKDDGVAFYASAVARPGYDAPLTRMWKSSTNSFLWVADREKAAAVANGYAEQKLDYFVSITQSECAQPVQRFLKGTQHRFASSAADIKALTAAGWKAEGAVFFAPVVTPTPAPGPVVVAPVAPKPTPTPAPKPTVQPAPTSAPVPAPAEAGTPATGVQVAGKAGSVAIGTATYAAPAGALYVAINGSDAAAGSAAAPFRTLAHAIDAAASGATIVLRAGTYNEGELLIPSEKKLTIQAASGEKVWLDGSHVLQGFTASGSVWQSPAGVRGSVFDTSPTFKFDAPDGTEEGWQFLNPAKPLASHPEQVWIGGVEQTQVATRAQVTAGTFFIDRTSGQVVLGTNPSGKTVQASNQQRALHVLGHGTTIRGIGITRFAPSVPHQGAVVIRGNDVTVENVVISDSATTGVGLFGVRGTLRQVSITGAGHLGVAGNMADGARIDRVYIDRANDQGFNTAPAAGAIKLARTNGMTVVDSVVTNTTGNAIWADEATYNIDITRTRVENSTGRGIFLEISSKGTIAGNLLRNNADEQIVIQNTDRINVWNNTIFGSSHAVVIGQDGRTPENYPQGLDRRRPAGDPEMTWVTANNVVHNNVFHSDGATARLLNVEDFTQARSGDQLVSAVNGNVYVRTSTGAPRWVVVWTKAKTDPSVYVELKNFAATGKETRGVQVTEAVYGADSLLTPALAQRVSTIAVAIPAAIATKLGVKAGATALGYVDIAEKR